MLSAGSPPGAAGGGCSPGPGFGGPSGLGSRLCVVSTPRPTLCTRVEHLDGRLSSPAAQRQSKVCRAQVCRGPQPGPSTCTPRARQQLSVQLASPCAGTQGHLGLGAGRSQDSVAPHPCPASLRHQLVLGTPSNPFPLSPLIQGIRSHSLLPLNQYRDHVGSGR